MGYLRSIWVEFFLFHRSCAGVKTPIPESSHPLLAIDEESSTAREYASFVTSLNDDAFGAGVPRLPAAPIPHDQAEGGRSHLRGGPQAW